MEKQELGPVQKAWVEALRSGKYKRGTQVLTEVDGDECKYCCLGVACEAVLKLKHVPGKEEGKLVRRYVTPECVDDPFVIPGQYWQSLGLWSSYGQFASPDPSGESSYLRSEYVHQDFAYYSIAQLNDETPLSFEQIADIIENNPSLVFKEAR